MASPDDATLETISSAQRVLLRWGIKTHGLGDHILVANRHLMLSKVFAGTPYAEKWAIHLKRVSGASIPSGVVRFGQVISRSTKIPWPIQT